jgi:hypothetical protein
MRVPARNSMKKIQGPQREHQEWNWISFPSEKAIKLRERTWQHIHGHESQKHIHERLEIAFTG